MSVRKVEDLVRERSPKNKSAKDKGRSAWAAEVRNLQDRLAHRFETKVEIKHKDNGSGQILINYFSNDDLNRLMDMLDFD